MTKKRSPSLRPRVLHIASEWAPWAASGGLGDVIDALPRYLQARGDLAILRMLPCYRSFLRHAQVLTPMPVRLPVRLGTRPLAATLYRFGRQRPQNLLLRRDAFFDRCGLYGEKGRDYPDLFARFLFFQKAAVEWILRDRQGIDLVHCHDWQCALIPLLLRQRADEKKSPLPRTLFTIHNLAYQGVFPPAHYGLTGLPWSFFNMHDMEYFGQLNCMKAGIAHADAVSTVSPTYAQEILTPAHGHGLEGFLSAHAHKLTGIINGMDSEQWDPARDPALPETYSAQRPENKWYCKRTLCRKYGLHPIRRDLPLFAMVTRLCDQKGLDLLAEIMPWLMAQPAAMILLGSGEARYEALLGKWNHRWPGRFHGVLGYRPDLARQIEAAADLYLMPSRYEPCGLNQMYSLRYGAVPIVHGTGGLLDTVIDLARHPRRGNGWIFHAYTPQALRACITKALDVFRNRSRWLRIMRRGMRADFSWPASAQAYAELYDQILRSREGAARHYAGAAGRAGDLSSPREVS